MLQHWLFLLPDWKGEELNFSILIYNLKIMLLLLQNIDMMRHHACLPQFEMFGLRIKSSRFFTQIDLSDIFYPRHVICILQGSAQLQGLDEERLAKMAEHLNQYNCQLSSMGPGFQTVSGWWLVSFILLIIKILKIVEPV